MNVCRLCGGPAERVAVVSWVPYGWPGDDGRTAGWVCLRHAREMEWIPGVGVGEPPAGRVRPVTTACEEDRTWGRDVELVEAFLDRWTNRAVYPAGEGRWELWKGQGPLGSTVVGVSPRVLDPMHVIQ